MRMVLKILILFFTLIFVVVGIAVAAYWTPDRSVESLKARWAPPPSQFISVAGIQVHLRDEGPRDDPLPLVLLHGTSSSLHTWEGWTQALKGQKRVISFDLPGFGFTGPAPDGNYRIENYVAFLTAVLDHLGVHSRRGVRRRRDPQSPPFGGQRSVPSRADSIREDGGVGRRATQRLIPCDGEQRFNGQLETIEFDDRLTQYVIAIRSWCVHLGLDLESHRGDRRAQLV